MSAPSRARHVSFNSLARGGLVDATYRLLAEWDFGGSRSDNFARAVDLNTLGFSSHSHARDLMKALQRRLEPDDRERPLAVLARRGVPIEVFRPCLLWHLTLDEFLLRDFLINWLYPAFLGGVSAVRSADLLPFVDGASKRGGKVRGAWSEATRGRAASSLLKFGADFGLLTGTVQKRFASYVLPDASFLYILHALSDQLSSPSRAAQSNDWRMFLMTPSAVEHELLRLHQYRKIEYQAAGSLVQLSLPFGNALTCAENMEVI